MAAKWLAALVLLAACATVKKVSAQQQQAAPSSQSQPQPPRPMRVRVSSGVANGLLVKRVNPDYPKDLRKRKVQGSIVVRVRISTGGDVIEATRVSGLTEFTQSALDAVKQWKFKPYLLNGQPVEVETDFLLNFTLAGS
jgi:periplasmic protein TonB